MKRILVSGLLNIETTAQVDSFPIEYQPIDYKFFGVSSAPSGVGLNIASALTALGDNVTLLSVRGNDISGNVIKESLTKRNISPDFVLPILKETPQSVVLYDRNGKRRIICDLKNAQEIKYDMDIFKAQAENCDCLCLCNINFSREMLYLARSMGKPIVTDVHALSNIDDEYNHDFMSSSDVLFLSDEYLHNPKKFVKEIERRFGNEIIIVGRGSKGALLYTKSNDSFYEIPAFRARKPVNTVGAGDALLSAFTHFYIGGHSPYDSLRLACAFASYKIGDKSASAGFLSESELKELLPKCEPIL